MKKEALPNYFIPKTLSQSVYLYLKEFISTNKLKANQRINEKEIAKLFQVSTTPVREAILRLGAEGFVTINSHREAVVKEVSFQELREIFQVLSALDYLAAGLAVQNHKLKDVKDIEKLTHKMESSFNSGSTEEYMELNIAIHNRIWKSVPNKFLQKTLQDVNDQLLRYNYARFHAYKKPGAMERSLKEHKEILEAIKAKNEIQLKEVLAQHWGSLLQPSPFADGLKEYLQEK